MLFSEPLYLGLLIPLLGWVVWTGRKMMGVSRARRRLILALRCLLVTVIVFALAGFQWQMPLRGVCTVFVVDRSASLSDEAINLSADYLRKALASAPEHALSAIVVFGNEAFVDALPAPRKTLPPLYSRPNPDGTDIAGALRLAKALVPDGYAPRIVLLSDGNETTGDARTVAQVAGVEGIPIDTVILPIGKRSAEVLIEQVQVPAQVKIGEPYEVRITVRSTGHAEGEIVLDRDGRPLKRLPARLSPGINTLTTTLQTDSAGIHRLRAVLNAHTDTDPRNNLGLALTFARGEPQVLIAEGRPGISEALRKVLNTNRIQTTLVDTRNFPARSEDLLNYDAIIFNDYPANALSPKQMMALQSAVRDGGVGFIMIGGESSYQPGGYYGTPIAEMLPVDLEIRHREVHHASTIILIVDASGSMNQYLGGHKIAHLAAEASIRTLKMLRPIDRFGVIISSHGSDWLLPEMARTNADPFSCEGRMFQGCHGQRAGQPASAIFPAEQRDAIIQVLQRVYGTGGGIFVRGSLEMAFTGMSIEAPTRTRHIVMLADANDCDEQEGSIALAQRMRAMGITLSVIAFGSGKDEQFLRQLAAAGGGQFYQTANADSLPQLFTADVSAMTRNAIEEGAFIPKVIQSDERLREVDWSRTPPLLAYNLTSERPLAQTLMRSHKDDPLLAVWRYGLGTVIAFTSDAQPKWSQRWFNWSGYSIFWTQVVRSALRSSPHSNCALTATVRQGQGIAELQAFTPDGEPLNNLSPQLIVSMPSGEQRTYAFQIVGAGRYSAQFPLGEIGLYTLSTEGDFGTGEPVVLTSALTIPYPMEYRFIRENRSLMEQVAHLSGGRVNPEPERAFDRTLRVQPMRQELWSLALLIALLLLMTDITLRRVVITIPEMVQVFLQGTYRRLRRKVQPAHSISRLQSAKARVSQRLSSSTLSTPSSQPRIAGTTPPSRTESGSVHAQPAVGTADEIFSSTDREANLNPNQEKKVSPTPSETASAGATTLSRLLEAKKKAR